MPEQSSAPRFNARMLIPAQRFGKSLADAEADGRVRQDVFGEKIVEIEHSSGVLEPRHKGTRGALIFTIGITSLLEGKLFSKWDARDVKKEVQHGDGRDDGSPPPVGGQSHEEEPPPKQRLEKVIGMTAVMPQTELADAFAFALKGRELSIGDAFANEGYEPEREADAFERVECRGGLLRDQAHGQHKQPDQCGLREEEPKEGPWRIRLPSLTQHGITHIFAGMVTDDTPQEVHAKSQTPQGDEGGDGKAARLPTCARDAIQQ